MQLYIQMVCKFQMIIVWMQSVLGIKEKGFMNISSNDK